MGASMNAFDTNNDGLADPIMTHDTGEMTVISGKLF